MKKKSISLLAASAINVGMLTPYQSQINQDISDATNQVEIYLEQIQLSDDQNAINEKISAINELLQKIQISNEMLASTESEWVKEK